SYQPTPLSTFQSLLRPSSLLSFGNPWSPVFLPRHFSSPIFYSTRYDALHFYEGRPFVVEVANHKAAVIPLHSTLPSTFNVCIICLIPSISPTLSPRGGRNASPSPTDCRAQPPTPHHSHVAQ